MFIHILYGYLIFGLFLAALNDIFIVDKLIQKEHPNMNTIDQMLCRFALITIVTVGWIPLGLYELCFVKGE